MGKLNNVGFFTALRKIPKASSTGGFKGEGSLGAGSQGEVS